MATQVHTYPPCPCDKDCCFRCAAFLPDHLHISKTTPWPIPPPQAFSQCLVAASTTLSFRGRKRAWSRAGIFDMLPLRSGSQLCLTYVRSELFAALSSGQPRAYLLHHGWCPASTRQDFQTALNEPLTQGLAAFSPSRWRYPPIVRLLTGRLPHAVRDL